MAPLYGLIGAGMGFVNNLFAQRSAEATAEKNYEYSEMAAQNADTRTRQLYKDIYSPTALLKEYKKAGLSPSIMFGGTPGQGGLAGAQGSGTTGQPSPYMPISLLEGAQLKQILAETEKTKAEAKNLEADTENTKINTQRQEIQRGIEQLAAVQYETEWELLNSTWTDTETGERTSLFEAARKHYTYESFLEWCRNGNTDEVLKKATQSEIGQKTLRSIYTGANQFHRDIMVLSEESISAKFQMNILDELEKTDYTKLNAQAAVQQLKTSIATDELTQSQKEAWNDLLDKLGKRGSTGRDIAIVLGMVLSSFGSKVGIKINTGK